jgi:hypothetical protein
MTDNKDLLDEIVKAVQSTGVIGEKTPIKAEILVCCGKLVLNKETTSTNLHPEDESRVGKDYVTEHVMLVAFYKDWIKFNSPSPTAISYTQRVKNIGTTENPTWTTEGKKITKDTIIYIKDASESFINGDDCKLLLEEKRVNLSKTDKGHTIHLNWEKPIVIVTTADTETSHQLIGRLPSLHLNSSIKQTKEIMEYQLNKDCGITNKKIDNTLIDKTKKFFYELHEVFVDLDKVKDEIKDKTPKCDETIMRSLYPRLLDYIKFSSALYQQEREKIDGSVIHIYANKQDVKNGIDIFNYIYKQDFADISTLNQRQRKMREHFIKNAKNSFSVAEINNWKMCTVSIPTTEKDLKAIICADNKLKLIDTYPKKFWYDGDIFEI